MKRHQFLNVTLVAAGAMLMLPSLALAQSDWPNKPVRVLVPFPAGGSTDLVARQVAQHLTSALGQQFIVDNRAGAGGNIGTDAVAKAAPDGYTLGLSTSGPLANNKHLYKTMPFDAQKDLTPIALVGEIPLVVTINPAVKAANLKEFVALSKANPAGYSVGHPGNGTIGHLTLELFKTKTGANPQAIPYKGDTPAMTDLLGGQIMSIFAAPPTAVPHVKAGKIRALATTGAVRALALPDLPTVAELGYPGYEALNWYCYLAPGKTPREIVQRWTRELVAVLSDADIKGQLLTYGMEAAPGTGEALQKYIEREFAVWGKVVKAAGITAN